MVTCCGWLVRVGVCGMYDWPLVACLGQCPGGSVMDQAEGDQSA